MKISPECWTDILIIKCSLSRDLWMILCVQWASTEWMAFLSTLLRIPIPTKFMQVWWYRNKIFLKKVTMFLLRFTWIWERFHYARLTRPRLDYICFQGNVKNREQLELCLQRARSLEVRAQYSPARRCRCQQDGGQVWKWGFVRFYC